jgi:hypothetical protein
MRHHSRHELVVVAFCLWSVSCASSSPSAGGTATGGGTASGGGPGSGGALATGTGGSRPGSGGGPAGTGGSLGGSGGAGGLAAAGTGGAVSAAGGRAGGGGVAGTGSGACPAGAIFCADFEAGSIPAQALFFPEYLRPMLPMFVAIDSTLAHSGTKSVKFLNSDGTSFSQMLGVATTVPRFWTRVYLRADVDMATQMGGHATYVAATDGNGDPNDGVQIRVGEHSCQLELNRKSDDKELLSNGGTYACSGGIVFAKDTWNCLEISYDGPNKEVRVFVNSVESTALHVTDWGPYAYSMFKFGFENYGSGKRNMWYDDVAIAAERIGCLP